MSRPLAPLGHGAVLLYQLGGEPFAVPVATQQIANVVELGTLADLTVWQSCAGTFSVGSVARQLARRGQLGIVIGHDPAHRRWLLAATLTPVRVSAVTIDDSDSLLMRRTRRTLATIRGTQLERLLALADALDVDSAGRRTFRELRQLLDHAVDLLPRHVPRDDRHSWALAQITRLLFLRFVESEGWLDNNPRFLATAFDRCLIARRDPTRHLLQPLFFGTLNRRWSDRSRLARSFGAVPFLNGGLFEPHAIERRYAMRLPVTFWRDAFAALIDRVDVSLDATTDDGRVTPELLGRVFEGVMQPEERKEQGTFFTPPALVDAILRVAISCHLAHRLGRPEEAVDQALDDPDPELHGAMLHLNVLDPAVGSGAFLVGALQRLHGPGPRVLARVRHLVTGRLYGVDRHPGAVRLTELRLWLEVLRALRGRPPGAIPPLPNLDSTIRAGDALIDPLHGQSLSAMAARRIMAGQRALRASHGAAKRAAIATARQGERRAVLVTLHQHDALLTRQINELLAHGCATTLFGESGRLSRQERAALGRLRRERAAVRREARRVTGDSTTAPFALTAAFAPVFQRRGGFDLVIGNPPWVRAERLSPAVRRALHERYQWWRSGTGRGWRHLPDLSVAFVERSAGLLVTGGTFALLLPAKILTAGYAASCRSALVNRTTLHCVADLNDDPRAGFDATTYPLIAIASRTPSPADHRVRLGLESHAPAVLQSSWRDQLHWSVTTPAIQTLARRLAQVFPMLADVVQLHIGVKTGANDLFLDPPAPLHAWCRPALRGRDVRPFRAVPSAKLLWPADQRGVAWPELPPPLAEYLMPVVPRLVGRSDQQRGPAWQLFRTHAATAPHRVVWRDLARELQAVQLNDPSVVPLNTCYVAVLPTSTAAAALTAWLNSSVVRVLARLGAEPAAGGCARFSSRTVGTIPIPRGLFDDTELIMAAEQSIISGDQSVLDCHAAELLELSREDGRALDELAANRR